MRSKETAVRSLVKSIVWRILATFGTWLMVFLFTGDPLGSLGGTLAAAALGTLGYYVNERVWNRIHWGKRHAD